MKILFLSYKFYPNVGGIESSSELLAKSFSEFGHEICLLTCSVDKQPNKFPFKIIRKPSLKDFLGAYKWADVVFENNPSLHLSWPNLFFRKPYVVSLHTWIARANGTITWRDKLKLTHLKNASCVIACSNAVRIGIWPEAIVIGNSYDETTFKRVTQVSRNLDFVFLGRLVSDKGADIVIKALAQLIIDDQKNNNYSLTVIGDGPELEPLKTLVAELGIEPYVNFTGNLSGEPLAICLNKHKYMVVPSLWEEPFGIVVLEGIACGCIPIVSNVGGLPDAVGNAGLLFNGGDINNLVKIINELRINDKLQEVLLNNAKDHLESHSRAKISLKYLTEIERRLIKR